MPFVGQWSPAVDLYEYPDRYLLFAEVPGLDAGQVDLSYLDNVLTIRGERLAPDGIDEELASRAPGAHMLDALTLANEAGHARAVNTVMLGAFSNYLDFTEDEWRSAIEKRVPPKTVDINLKAFELGRKAGAR